MSYSLASIAWWVSGFSPGVVAATSLGAIGDTAVQSNRWWSLGSLGGWSYLAGVAGLVLALIGFARRRRRSRSPEALIRQPQPGPSGTPALTGAPATTDRLASLRRMARKKGKPFAEELTLFLAEFAAELDQLSAAIRHQDARRTGRYAHLLCGRCAFVGECDLGVVVRKIEAGAAAGQWEHARSLCHAAHNSLAELPVRLASAGPVSPDASDR